MKRGAEGSSSAAMLTRGLAMLPTRAMVLPMPRPVCLWAVGSAISVPAPCLVPPLPPPPV